MDSFYNSSFILKYQKDNFVSAWTAIIIVSILVLLIVLSNYSYNKYLILDGSIIKKEEEYYVNAYIKKDDIANIYNEILIINEDIIDYKIIDISKDYIIGQDMQLYKNILLTTNLKENILIENNVVKLKWKYSKTTIMNEIIVFIKKGLMEWNK